MQDWPEWFQRALRRRSDELANASSKQYGIYMVRMRLNDFTKELKKQTAPDIFIKILEWEETVNHWHAMEKEWQYIERVKDGIRLMYPPYSGLGNNYFKT